MPNVVADANIPCLDETFGSHARVVRREGRRICRADLADAEALLVRSVTRVDSDLLKGTPVKFVGTATIGTDHLDTAWLDAAGITWASAPGCNAAAAAQYTLAMMMLACERLESDFFEQTVGIIGHGNVGSRLAALLQALGVECVANDPPLEAAGQRGLVSLDKALAQDIVSLHVPLTRTGPHPTWRMISEHELGRIPDGGVLVNAARGDVLDGDALLRELAIGRLHAALDTWPGEPEADPALVTAATVATPHVAGYSHEGKVNGTYMIYGKFLSWLGQGRLMSGLVPETLMSPTASSLTKLIVNVTGVERDDARLRKILDLEQHRVAAAFDRLRAEYPTRHEFTNYRVIDPELVGLAEKLGFRV